MKRITSILVILFTCITFVTACGNTENKKASDEITFTNKFECERKEKYTVGQIYYKTKKEALKDAASNTEAVEVTFSRLYDFNENGDKLLAYYDVAAYNYLVDYDMNEQKKFYEDECENRDKESYDTCKVTMKDNIIKVTMKGTPSTNKEWFSSLTLELVKEDYKESPYTCK